MPTSSSPSKISSSSRNTSLRISVPFSSSTLAPAVPSFLLLWTSFATIAAERLLFDALAGDVERQLDVVLRLAVVVADDHVLRDVDETPRQVSRVGRAQRRVGETLAGAVGRDEVLEHREAFHEVGLDRTLDDLALRIRHQAAHAGELADLRERAAGAGVGHHEDRVQLVERASPSRCATVSVASVQRLTMISCRSSSVIRPRACWPSTVATRPSKSCEDLLLVAAG